MENLQNVSASKSSKKEEWFAQFIHSLKVDLMQLETQTASKEKKEMYQKLIDGDRGGIIADMRRTSSTYFIQELVRDYVGELTTRKVEPSALAFELSNSSVLVWAEINDDDEDTESKLILSEAKVNSKYSDKGFFISSTIIEKGDNISIPNQYINIVD